MDKIDFEEYMVHVGEGVFSEFEKQLSASYKKSKVFILVDENSLKYCLPIFLQQVPFLKEAEVLEIESGEESKNLEVCTQIWSVLSEMHADRKSVFINLGGGVITDMGGFIASCYMRGIDFFHVPTTVLAQVDAAIGGKVGVDLGNLKNLVGAFSNPKGVFMSPEFFRTLHTRDLISGFAEIVKHALIYDVHYWNAVKSFDMSALDTVGKLVKRSVEIKHEIVVADPFESGIRKALNFGHTIGHAIESYSLESQTKSLKHGEAIAVGMVCEAFLSAEKKLISKEELEEVSDFIFEMFPVFKLQEMMFHRFLEIMKHDKKNENNELHFSLLDGIGGCKVNQVVSPDDVLSALNYYRVMSAAV